MAYHLRRLGIDHLVLDERRRPAVRGSPPGRRCGCSHHRRTRPCPGGRCLPTRMSSRPSTTSSTTCGGTRSGTTSRSSDR
ncbi:hypothetical protein [Janibacter anophelis]|uniref:hypothetical protein n=1 Tax=Janibacter anophelis TaxID=319054 RepID=UPI00278C2ED6|nr:hypothetical protein [Janibacter anophelis]